MTSNKFIYFDPVPRTLSASDAFIIYDQDESISTNSFDDFIEDEFIDDIEEEDDEYPCT